MRLVGIVGSGSTTTYAPVIVWDKYEHVAKEEQLVMVDDERRGIKYLGVLRGAKRYEPFLNAFRRTSYVDNPELADMGTLPHTSVYVALIGVVSSDGALNEVQLPPNPGSKVQVIESPEDLGVDLGEGLVVGHHKYSGVEVPLSPEWLPYHLAVVGATGTGKSRLVKALLDEVLSKTRYRVIVFDHTGMDYVRYYPARTVQASRVVLDVALITDLMLEKTGLNPTTYEPYLLISTLYYLFRTLPKDVRNEVFGIEGGEGKAGKPNSSKFGKTGDLSRFGLSNPRSQGGGEEDVTLNDMLEGIDKLNYSALLKAMAKHAITWDKAVFKSAVSEVAEFLRGRNIESVKIRLGVAIDVKLGDAFFTSLSERDLLPSDIVDKAFRERLVVVDLSTEDTVVRRYVVAAVINELWRRISESREPVDTIVVIDEAHNYACRYCGEAGKAIGRIAREGRKWGLGVVLVTQRIIDLDPEVRGNINTWFFSKLQTPSDFNELKGYMNLAWISEQSLAILGRREFYVAGLMNPLKIPVLLKVREVSNPERTR